MTINMDDFKIKGFWPDPDDAAVQEIVEFTIEFTYTERDDN